VNLHRLQVAAVLDAVTVEGMRFRWLGDLSPPLPLRLRRHLDLQVQHEHLRDRLREELYSSFYCQGRVTRPTASEPRPLSADPRLVRAMAEANAGRHTWERGWTVERTDGERTVVASRALRVWVATSACRPVDAAIAVGGRVSLVAPTHRPSLWPGFFTVLGEAGHQIEGALVRVYWNVVPAGGPPLVRALTSALNTDEIAFRLKVLDHPLRFGRCDAAVLYLRAADFPRVRGLLTSTASDLAHFLRPAVPAFTHQLAPGLAASECEGASGSFGRQRCTLLADALLDCHDRGASSSAARLAGVAAHFASCGVDIDAPYRDPRLDGRHVL
jgi:HopA1 effector protein family